MGDLQFAKQFLTTLDNKPTKYQSNHVFDPKTFQMRLPYTLPKLPHPPHPLPPKSTPTAPPPPGAEPSPSNTTISITLKSNRNPAMTLTIPSIHPVETTIQSIKEAVQSHLGGSSVVSLEKIKILSNKKPIPSSKKTIADALEGVDIQNGQTVEFGVMVMGGAPDPPPQLQEAVEQPDTISASGPGPGSEKAAAEAALLSSNASVPSIPNSDPMVIDEKDPSTTSAVQPGEPSGKDVVSTPEFWSDLQGFLEQRIRDTDEAGRLRGVFERAWRSGEAAP